MRIELLDKDSSVTGSNSNYHTYINELKSKLTSLTEEYSSIQNIVSVCQVSSDTIDIIKNKMKYFINNIKIEIPDRQSIMPKEFIETIRYNLINDVVEIKVSIKSPESTSETIFEKYLYTSF